MRKGPEGATLSGLQVIKQARVLLLLKYSLHCSGG